MSSSKLFINLRTCQPIVHQVKQLSCFSEICQSNVKSKPSTTDTIKSDILVIGDGVLANSIAYWLKATNAHKECVTVVESESFKQSQFNVPTNSQFNSVEAIQLSKFTNKFISRLNAEFKLRPSLSSEKELWSNDNLCEQKSSIGLLQFSENIAGELELVKYNKLFKQLFASTEYASELLNSKQLNEMFTWLNSDHVRLARFHSRDDLALTNINLVQLNNLFKLKAKQLGVQYLKGEVHEMNTNNNYEEDIYGVTSLKKSCNEVTINRLLNQNLYASTNLRFSKMIIACPADQSKLLANMLGLDKNNQWPVENRQRFIYEIQCQSLTNENLPVIVDSYGLWLRKDQFTGNFYCGINSNENIIDDESNKLTNFSKLIWPRLINLIPSLKNIELVNCYQQNYDCNLIDDNGIVGIHPEISNLYWLLGFNGNHEIWAPGLGKASSEYHLDKRYNGINLEKFSWHARALNKSRFKQRLSN